VHDDAGKLLYVFGSQIDLTDFRKVQVLEASEHRLMMEVDHRARNVLAVVNGIVRLSRADDAARYAAAIQRRVQALAEAHTLLAERGWQEVPLDRVVGQQIDGYASPRVRLEGPYVGVPAIAVQPLAVVFHELVSNAARHGSLASDAGELSVRWGPTAEDGGFTLRWEEAGGPARTTSPQPGFGLMMIRGMVERQLQGSVEQAWTPDGLVVTLSVPGPQNALQG
jgi:two-component sensor histidine kinase